MVGVGDVAGDGEAESGASLVAAAGRVEAGEGLEDSFVVGGRDTGPVVGDGKFGGGVTAL